MISPWLAWVLTVAGFLGVASAGYLFGRHRGYLAGLGERLEHLPVNPPWAPPPSEGEFMSELFDDLRRNEPPQRYRRQS